MITLHHCRSRYSAWFPKSEKWISPLEDLKGGSVIVEAKMLGRLCAMGLECQKWPIISIKRLENKYINFELQRLSWCSRLQCVSISDSNLYCFIKCGECSTKFYEKPFSFRKGWLLWKTIAFLFWANIGMSSIHNTIYYQCMFILLHLFVILFGKVLPYNNRYL